jgi:hypothetical protein
MHPGPQPGGRANPKHARRFGCRLAYLISPCTRPSVWARTGMKDCVVGTRTQSCIVLWSWRGRARLPADDSPRGSIPLRASRARKPLCPFADKSSSLPQALKSLRATGVTLKGSPGRSVPSTAESHSDRVGSVAQSMAKPTMITKISTRIMEQMIAVLDRVHRTIACPTPCTERRSR